MNEYYQILLITCSYICHQNPERSYVISGIPFFLCARCTGIYGLLLTSLIVLPIMRFRVDGISKYYLSLAVSIFLNIILWQSGIDNNVARTLLGAVIGFSLGLLIYTSILNLKEDKNEKYFK